MATAIYNRVCANCHGTKEQPGSLPTAPRFASATLKNGGDPYHMYRTLTDGFGQMAAQTWLVPQQKYDLIHYIREAYFKPDNPSLRPRRSGLPGATFPRERPRARAGVDRALEHDGLRAQPVGDAGSRHRRFEHRLQGNCHSARRRAGGISRGRAWVVYDHETLRLAAAWTGQGFIDWDGINFNGRHQVHPRIVGKVHATTATGPAGVTPNQSFADLRVRGRDGRFYGPLPRNWAYFKGLYRHGDRVILAYTVGTAEILETPGLETDRVHPDQAIFTRTLEIGPSPDDLTMRVADEGTAVSLTEMARQACSGVMVSFC